jgi:hypothetical protein
MKKSEAKKVMGWFKGYNTILNSKTQRTEANIQMCESKLNEFQERFGGISRLNLIRLVEEVTGEQVP